MKKYFPLFWVFYLLCAFSAHAGEGRYTLIPQHILLEINLKY